MTLRYFLIGSFLAAGWGVSAQVSVLNDTFSNGSTLDSTSPAAPTAVSTSYQEIASKNWTPNPPTLSASNLTFGIAKTSGGGGEIQALFTTAPVALLTAGDYVQVTATFTNTLGLLTQDTQLGMGVFNSAGSAPWAGGLNSTANNGDNDAVTGGAQNWTGYLAQVDYPSGLGGSRSSQIFARPAQTGTDNRNQVTIVPGSQSGIYGYPNSITVGGSFPASNIALVTGGTYTEVMTLALQTNNTLEITAKLYTNDATGTPLTMLTSTTSGAPITSSFDAFSLGWRSAGNVTATTINLRSIQVIKFIQSEGSCISETATTSSMVIGQSNQTVTINIPAGSAAGGPLSMNLISTNPTAAYAGGAAGGTLTVTFPQGAPYTMTNLPITAAAAGSTLFYLTNASAPACISASANSSVLSVTTDAYVPPALPVIPAGVFNVTNYGAIGNGTTTNSTAIQAAISAAQSAGGGTVEVPAGTFLSGPFTVGSKIRFQLDAGATLLMLPFTSYPGGAGANNPPDFITVDGAHDVEFCGPGKMDGQGADWWSAGLDENHRPYAIHLTDCQRVFFHDWNSTNPPMKHIVFDGNDSDITVQNTTNSSPPSPNTDGLNLQGDRCLVQNCTFVTGDDNIAMGRGSGSGKNIMIRNITCGHGHGISIGSVTSAGISNVTVMNCTFNGTDYGLRLKADNDRGGVVQNINYANITMTNVQSAILIYSYYNEGKSLTVSTALAASYGPSNVTSKTPIWRNITFSNITASTTVEAGIIWGRPEMLVSNVTLDHVTITAPKTFHVYHARGIQMVDTQINLASGSKFTLYDAELTLTNRTPGAATASIDGLTSSNALTLYNAPASMSSPDVFGASPITLWGSAFTNTGTLTLPASTILNFAVGANASVLTDTGSLTLNSTVNVSDGGGFKPGTYTLLRYTGSLSGSPVLGTTPPGYQCSLNTSLAGQVRLLVSARPPSIGSISLGGGGALNLSGSGGPPNYNYYLLSSTNAALPLTNWTRVTTNLFDALGNFNASSGSNVNPQTFYRLQVP